MDPRAQLTEVNWYYLTAKLYIVKTKLTRKPVASKKATGSSSRVQEALGRNKKLTAGAVATLSLDSFESALDEPVRRTGSNACLHIKSEEGDTIEVWSSKFEDTFEWDEEQELFVQIEGTRLGRNTEYKSKDGKKSYDVRVVYTNTED